MAPPSALLDAAFFPHIIDRIFEEAPRASLMALRVNKAWKERAERHFAYHITIEETGVKPGFPMNTTYRLESVHKDCTKHLGDVDSSPVRTIPLPIALSFLSSTAVIDMNLVAFKFETKRLLQHCSPNVTFRFHRRCNLWNIELLKPHCLVLFAKDMRPNRAIDYFNSHGLRALQGCSKLVLHVGQPGRSALALEHHKNLKGVQRLTLVVGLWYMPVIDQMNTEVLPNTMGLLADLVIMGWVAGAPVTVVGFDFYEDANLEDTLITHLVNWLAHRWRHVVPVLHNPHASSGGPYANVRDMPELRFLSQEEYRAEVGEAAFNIEMNPGPIHCPHFR